MTKLGMSEFPQAEHLMGVKSSCLLLVDFTETLDRCSPYESFV